MILATSTENLRILQQLHNLKAGVALLKEDKHITDTEYATLAAIDHQLTMLVDRRLLK